jgi:hypothetical protein
VEGITVHGRIRILRPIQCVTEAESDEQNMTEQQKVETPPQTRQSGISSNTIFIGKKPIMAYVTALMMQFTSGSSEVIVKARGRAISAAVDVVEVCRLLQEARRDAAPVGFRSRSTIQIEL